MYQLLKSNTPKPSCRAIRITRVIQTSIPVNNYIFYILQAKANNIFNTYINKQRYRRYLPITLQRRDDSKETSRYAE